MQVPGRPFAAVPSRDGTYLFVSLSNLDHGGAIAVLQRDGDGYELRRTFDVAGFPMGLALTPDGRRLAVATGRTTIIFDVDRLVAGDGDPVTVRIAGEFGAIYVAFSPDGRLLATSEEIAGRVTLVEPNELELTRISLPVPQAPVGLAFSPEQQWLFVTSEYGGKADPSCPAHSDESNATQGTVSVIDLQTRLEPRLVATASIGCGPVRIVISPDGTLAYVSLRNENKIVVVRTDDLLAGQVRRIDTVQVGPSPVGLALSADGSSLLIANSNRFRPGQAGSVICFALGGAGRAFRASTIRFLGAFPRELSLIPASTQAVVTLFGSSRLEFVPHNCADAAAPSHSGNATQAGELGSQAGSEP